MVEPNGVVVIVFLTTSVSRGVCRFDSVSCNTFFITHMSCDMNGSAMSCRRNLNLPADPPGTPPREANFLNNSSKTTYIKKSLRLNDPKVTTQL